MNLERRSEFECKATFDTDSFGPSQGAKVLFSCYVKPVIEEKDGVSGHGYPLFLFIKDRIYRSLIRTLMHQLARVKQLIRSTKLTCYYANVFSLTESHC